MFSKAYNNKPRGLSHASWENRSKRPEYQLRARVREAGSEYACEWERVGEWGRYMDIIKVWTKGGKHKKKQR